MVEIIEAKTASRFNDARSLFRAFGGERLAIRPHNTDGIYGVYFASRHVATIDLTKPRSVSHVCEQVSTMVPA